MTSDNYFSLLYTLNFTKESEVLGNMDLNFNEVPSGQVREIQFNITGNYLKSCPNPMPAQIFLSRTY